MAIFCHHKLEGVSHKDIGCQDWFAYKDNGVAIIAAVADGVSSNKHSAFGSKTASETAVSFCKENIKPSMKPDDILRVIYQSFDEAWRAVEKGARDKNFDVRKCNTTLSLAVFISGDVYYGHVGDSGIFAFFEDGKVEPITTQQNDADDRVYTLSSGPNKWEFNKASKKASSLLLCTDGIWKMFHPDRLSDKHEKHSVPLLAWYIDPEAIKVHSKGKGLQKWLEADMDEINEKRPDDVNHDDITIVIIYDDKVRYKRQPEIYYKPPSKVELKQAEEAEHERLYGHLDDKKRSTKKLPLGDSSFLAVHTLEKLSEYDKTYKLSLKKRTVLARDIFEELLKLNKSPLFGKKFPFRCPCDISFIVDESFDKLEIRFSKQYSEDNEVYYRIIGQVAKLLTNGLSLSQSKDPQCIAYRFDENKPGFKEDFLPKMLSDLFRESFFAQKERAVLPSPKKWLIAIEQYSSMLKISSCQKKGHFSITGTSRCLCCDVDKAYSK